MNQWSLRHMAQRQGIAKSKIKRDVGNKKMAPIAFFLG
jgi:hypothetical protein